MRHSLVGLVAAFSISACGGGAVPDAQTPPASPSAAPTASAAATASSAPTTSPAALPLAALKITGLHGKDVQELTAEGAVLINGKPAGKLSGREMKDVDGKPLLSLESDGKVTYTLGDAEVRFDDKDELLLPGGSKMTVDDDGGLRMTRGDGAAANARVEGFKPQLRRTTLVLAFGVYLIGKSAK